MSLTHDQKIKLDNFKEHYKVLLANIQSANKEISSLLAEKEKAESKLREKTEELNLVQNELSEIKKEISSLKESAKRAIVAVDLHKESVLNEIRELEQNARTLVEASSKERSKIIKSIDSYDEVLLKLKFKEGQLSDAIKKHTEEIIDLEDTKRGLQDSIKELRSEHDSVISIAADEVKAVEEKMKTAENKLNQILAEIERQEPKIKNALIEIERREGEVKKREDDAAVLVRRIKKWYNKNRPGIKIEL